MKIFKIRCHIAWLYVLRFYSYCMYYFWTAVGIVCSKLMGVFKNE